MPTDAAKLTAQDLQEHASLIEGIARAIARDDDVAQDLVQDAYVAGLVRPPRPGTPLRPWLVTVQIYRRYRWAHVPGGSPNPYAEDLLWRHQCLVE